MVPLVALFCDKVDADIISGLVHHHCAVLKIRTMPEPCENMPAL